MSKVDWNKEREVQATRQYLADKTRRETANAIKALRERDPAFDALCRKQELKAPQRR